jgi:hypothetical protein
VSAQAIDGDKAFRALRKVAMLRSTFRRLPHVPTPAEADRLSVFEAFLTGARPDCPPNALLAGLRAAWRAGDRERVVAAVDRMGGDWRPSDPDLGVWQGVAEGSRRERGRRT